MDFLPVKVSDGAGVFGLIQRRKKTCGPGTARDGVVSGFGEITHQGAGKNLLQSHAFLGSPEFCLLKNIIWKV